MSVPASGAVKPTPGTYNMCNIDKVHLNYLKKQNIFSYIIKYPTRV
jgi:hypothetical protein